MPLRAFTLSALSLVPFGLLTACGVGVERTRLEDGSYRLRCEFELAHCLQDAQEHCKENGYEVLSATEGRSRAGPIGVQSETVRSEAHVKCRPRNVLFTFEPEPAASVEPPPPLPPHEPLPPIGAPPSPAAPVDQSGPSPGGAAAPTPRETPAAPSDRP
jgi:hypothetical protein